MNRHIRALTLLLSGFTAAGGALADTGACGTNVGGALPDLVVNVTKLIQYLSVGEEKSAPASCAVQEGFVSGPGWHTLMRFTTSTANVGTGRLVIGDPAQCPGLFEQSSCHGHMHMHDYAAYRLWTPGGWDTWVARRNLEQPTTVGVNAAVLLEAARNKSLVQGRKMGFCMMDTDIYVVGASPTPTYVNCNLNQGISVGWADTYSAPLDGQSIEVDGLKSGDYVLEMHVNPEHVLAESNYGNNSSAIRIRYTARRGGTPATVQVLP